MTDFDGFYPPTQNWSKLPHQFIDLLPEIATIGEMKVILYILRHTWGYGDERKRITTDEFINGRKRKDGSRLDNGTGLSAPTVRSGIEAAIEHGFIQVEIDKKDLARIRKYYSLVTKRVEKDLLSGSKEFTIGGQKTLQRTEKETTRNIPQKDNGDNRKKIEPLDHLQSYTEDEVTEDTAPNPQDQWLTYRNEVLDSYVNQTNIRLNQGQKGELALLPDTPNFDISTYHKYLAEFTARGGYAYDVKAFCEGYVIYCKTGDIYEAMGRKRLAEPDKPKEREYPELNKWVGPDGTVVTW